MPVDFFFCWFFLFVFFFFFFKQKTAYEIGLGIPAEPLFRSNFFSDKLVLTSVTPASSAPVLQTPKATSSTLYFDSLTVNAGNGGFLHCIQMDTSVNAANQVVSVGADIAFDADPKFFRSEERRVGKECRSGWWSYHLKENSR